MAATTILKIAIVAITHQRIRDFFVSALEIFLLMRYINLRLLTYLLTHRPIVRFQQNFV